MQTARDVRRWWATAGLLVGAACAPDAVDGPGIAPTLEIRDALRGGDPAFYWLSPVVTPPAPTGTFHDHATVAVEIAELSTGRVAARFATGGGPAGPVLVERAIPAYITRWNTRRCNPGPCVLPSHRVYRISVIVSPVGHAPFVAGYADAFLVTSPNEAARVDRSRFVPVVNGDFLSVRFRIEDSMVGGIRVTPVGPTIVLGQQLQLVASVVDLDGQAMAANPSFFTSNAAVAVVTSTGKVTGVMPGSAYLYAQVGSRRDSTLVTVTGGGEIAPAPRTPFSGARVLQDNAASGCAIDPVAGNGFVIPLTWSNGVGPLPVIDYEVRVHHPASGSVLLDGRVSQVGSVVSGCAQLVDDARLDGWEFLVRAVYADQSTGPWGAATFGFLAGGTTSDFTLDPPDFGAGKTQVSINGNVDAITSATVGLLVINRTPMWISSPPLVELFLGDGSLQDAFYRAIGSPTVSSIADNGIFRRWSLSLTWDPAAPVVPGTHTVRASGTLWDGRHVVTAGSTVTIVP
ncbi:MAG: hypothetical protein JNL26_08955 [Gemmatimonadetes bacterium]|nr:hypothetical protein [Gemmatimonadota bacterium]